MQSKIISRIVAESGMPRLFSALAEQLTPGDLQSLLLTVYQSRVQGMSAPSVLARTESNALAAPSSVDARLLNAFDRIAFAAATDFEAVELSPVCPLGTNFALGGIDQNNVLTTIRNAEVLGDSTPALALEIARRRKHAQRASDPPVRLCSSHRCIRLQPFDIPGFTPHFRLFGMVSGGRDTGSSAFEIQHLTEHIRFYLKLFRGLYAEGFSLTSPLVEISDLAMTEALLTSAGISRDEVRKSVRAHIAGGSERFLSERGLVFPTDAEDARLKQHVFEPLRAEFPEAEFRFNLARLEGLGYYTGWCLRISPAASDGVRYPIADGGFTDWTARLLQDKKERLLISGIGSEFVCRRYR
jgi:hypothetical protein